MALAAIHEGGSRNGGELPITLTGMPRLYCHHADRPAELLELSGARLEGPDHAALAEGRLVKVRNKQGQDTTKHLDLPDGPFAPRESRETVMGPRAEAVVRYRARKARQRQPPKCLLPMLPDPAGRAAPPLVTPAAHFGPCAGGCGI